MIYSAIAKSLVRLRWKPLFCTSFSSHIIYTWVHPFPSSILCFRVPAQCNVRWRRLVCKNRPGALGQSRRYTSRNVTSPPNSDQQSGFSSIYFKPISDASFSERGIREDVCCEAFMQNVESEEKVKYIFLLAELVLELCRIKNALEKKVLTFPLSTVCTAVHDNTHLQSLVNC